MEDTALFLIDRYLEFKHDVFRKIKFQKFIAADITRIVNLCPVVLPIEYILTGSSETKNKTKFLIILKNNV